MMSNQSKSFYDKQYAEDRYASATVAEAHSFYPKLTHFIEKHHLEKKRLLEIGCGRGAFQDVVSNYVGIDLSENAGKNLHKPFSQASATELPFADNSFDAAWSYAVLEHVPSPEKALYEMRRVLKPDGLLFLAPAWQCRSWAAQGYPVRPYRDFGIKGKIIKASIPIRNSVVFRSSTIFPKRLYRLLQYLSLSKPIPFHYKEIEPNYEIFWMSDSDAINSIDPYDAIVWFCSRGDVCLSYPSVKNQFFVRTGGIVFQIKK